MAYSKGSTEASLMKALLPEGCGGRVQHLRLAAAGSHYYLGLKGLEEEAGSTEPRRAARWPGGEAGGVLEELPSTWRRADTRPRGAGAGMADAEKPRHCPSPLDDFLPLGCIGPKRLV